METAQLDKAVKVVAPKYTALQKQQALDTLEKFAQIVRNEMLMHGVYFDSDITNEKLAKAGAPCGGHRACAVGSLYLAYGVQFNPNRCNSIDGVLPYERATFMKDKPTLKLIYDTLNEEAGAYAVRKGLWHKSDLYSPDEDGDGYKPSTGMFEDLFEDYYQGNPDDELVGEPHGFKGDKHINRKDMLQITTNAKRRIRSL